MDETCSEKIKGLADRYGALHEHQYSEEGWGELSEAVEALQSERDSLAAEVEALKAKLDVPEGCTPADAEVLRRANHALAAEVEALRPDAEAFRTMVLHGIDLDEALVALGGEFEHNTGCPFARARLAINRDYERTEGAGNDN